MHPDLTYYEPAEKHDRLERECAEADVQHAIDSQSAFLNQDDVIQAIRRGENPFGTGREAVLNVLKHLVVIPDDTPF